MTNTNARLTYNVSAELDSESKLTEENAIYRHGHQFAEHLGQGLADNWSQVQQNSLLVACVLPVLQCWLCCCSGFLVNVCRV